MTTSILIDLVLAVIFAQTIWNGYRRGFVKSISRLLSFVGAALCAVIGTPVLSGFLCTLFIMPLVQSFISQTVSAAVGNAIDAFTQSAGSAADVIEEAAGELSAYVEAFGLSVDAFAESFMGILGVTPDSDAVTQYTAQITNTFADPIAERLSDILAYLIIFIVAYVIFRIAFRFLSVLAHLPILHAADKLLGLCTGSLLGAVYVFIIANLVSIVLTLLTAGGVLPYEDIMTESGPVYELFTGSRTLARTEYDFSQITLPELAAPEMNEPSGTETIENTF